MKLWRKLCSCGGSCGVVGIQNSLLSFTTGYYGCGGSCGVVEGVTGGPGISGL